MTRFLQRYKQLLINKTNAYITIFVMLLLAVGVYFTYLPILRAEYLLLAYLFFMVVYQAINAQFLSDAKFQLFLDEGVGGLGNPIAHNSHLGRIFHYLLMGLIFAFAVGNNDYAPTEAFRGFSNFGLIFAGAYGIFSELKIKKLAALETSKDNHAKQDKKDV